MTLGLHSFFYVLYACKSGSSICYWNVLLQIYFLLRMVCFSVGIEPKKCSQMTVKVFCSAWRLWMNSKTERPIFFSRQMLRRVAWISLLSKQSSTLHFRKHWSSTSIGLAERLVLVALEGESSPTDNYTNYFCFSWTKNLNLSRHFLICMLNIYRFKLN